MAPIDEDRPRGDGEVAALITSYDWSTFPLGAPAAWPQSLRATVQLIIGSKFPMFVAWGTDLRFFYNDAYAEILGAKHPAALGEPFRNIWSEIWPEIFPLIDAALAGQATYRQDMPLLMDRSGYDEQTWFTFSYSPVYEDDGKVAGIFCACAESTDRMLAERALSESESRFRNMADHAPVMMWITDADGACTYLNRGWYDFTGQAQRRGEGSGWLDAAHPDDKANALKVFQDASASRQPFSLEYRLRRADGTYRWALDAGAPRFDEAGHYLGYVGSVIDINERRESEMHFRLMADAVPQIVWITDAEGRVEFFNRHWHDYTGASSTEATAADVAAGYIHPDDGAATMAAFEHAQRMNSTFLVEHRIRSAAGDYRWFLVRGEPYLDPASKAVTRWYGASIDIHDRKIAEAKLKELNATLQTRVTEALAERNLLADLVEGTDAFVQVAGPDYRWLAINKASAKEFERIYGK